MSKKISFLRKILDEYNEFLIMPIMFVALLFSDDFLRFFDPTAGSFDLGILQTVVVAGFGAAWVFCLSWVMFKLSWPVLAKWTDDTMENRLNDFSRNDGYSPFHFSKATLCLLVYFGYVAVNTIILVALL